MKILHLNHGDDGGAGRAMMRLHRGLVSNGVDSQAFVHFKGTGDPRVSAPEGFVGKLNKKLRLAEQLQKLPLNRYKQRSEIHFSPSRSWVEAAMSADSVASVVERINPDVVHLHWVNNGFMDAAVLSKINKPIVWTLHDMWAFTGGCHYSGTCTRYRESCGSCPALNSNKANDLSRAVWKRKKRHWQNVPMTIVAPSTWMGQAAKQSSLFGAKRVEVIANGIDMATFHPIDRLTARRLLNLPTDKHLILLGASNVHDTRKGMHLLPPAFGELKNMGLQESVELMVFGEGAREISEWGFKVNALGKLHDDIALVLAYSAADVFVAPSLEDNLPNTLVEALACGTPCIAFEIGGIPDIIDHHVNGFLAAPRDSHSLADGIRWVLTEADEAVLRQQSRLKAEQAFDQNIQAQRHATLYSELLGRSVAKTPVPVSVPNFD
ncbi:MAG: glycosyltransferase family 4 protein [Cytophagales bacterium]|nr:glycosyltransferase family 4 protein [Cytophagales bacterium]